MAVKVNAGGGNIEEWFSQTMNWVASNVLDTCDIGERVTAENGSVKTEIVIQDETNLPDGMVYSNTDSLQLDGSSLIADSHQKNEHVYTLAGWQNLYKRHSIPCCYWLPCHRIKTSHRLVQH